MTVKKAAISIGDWLKSTGFSAEKTLASAQEQRKNLLQQMDNANASYLTGENRGALQNAFSNYQATMNVLRGAGYDIGNDVDVMRGAVHSSFDFQNQFKDENDFNVSYAYPKKYKGKTRTDVNAALTQLKNTPGAEAEYDWLNKNQMNYWSADELKAQIGAWQNEISGIERQRRNMPRMAAGSTDADYAKRQQEALALSGQIDERKAKIGKAQSLLTRKTYDDEISKWDTQMQRALSDYSKALSVSESANTEMAMAGNSAFVVQNSDYATNARNTVRSFEQQLRDYGYSDRQINGIRNYALTQQHANEAAEMAQQVAQEAKEHPWLASAMSVGTNMMAGAGALDIAAQNALNGADPFTGEKMAVDRYTKSMVPSTVTNTIRGSVSEDMSGIGSFLYNTGMSMADSLATLAVGGATGLHGAADVILGGAAASQAITDAYDRGASDSQAMSVGLLYGTAEALFEHISLGKLRMFHTSAAAGKKTAKTLVKDMLKQSFVEGSEEVCTDIANVISDAIVMADKSEINQTIAAYQADGMSEDEATRRAWLDWLGQTAQDFAGGVISGGVMTGGDMALNAVMRSANYRETGRQITANDYADILRHAAEESGDENLRKLAGKKQTDRNTGKLYEATQEANLTQAVSDRLGALGTPENDVQELTGLVVKQIKGQELTGKEQRKFDASKQAQRAANEYASLFTSEADRTTNAWARSHMRDAAELERNAIYGGARKTDAGQTQMHQAEKNAEVQVNGETAQVQALRYDQENGSVELSVKAKNGDVQRVSVKDAKLPEGTRLLAESAEKYGETAPQMYANYQNGQDVERYASAYEVAYSYGRAGVKNYAVLENSGAASYLTPEQRKFAYETGLAAARRESDAKSAAAKSGEIQAGSVTLEGGKLGNVTLAAVNTAGLTRKQTASIDVARKVAEATGVNVVFFESQTGEDGKYLGMNGAYRDGTIYLDVNAGKNNVGTGETAILKTMSHELTHFIQQNSGQYEALKEFVANHVLESGDSIERLAQQKLDNDSTGELTMGGAMDEVVADACEMMLRNTEAVQRLANENRSLAEKIRDWIGDFVKKLRAAFKGDRATHDEARAMLDRMVELQKLWDDALVDAAKTKAAKENTAGDGSVQEQASKTQYQIKYPRFTEKDIERNSVTLQSMSPVEHLTGDELGARNLPLKTRVTDYFNSLGNNVYTEQFGDVALKNSSVHSEFRHGNTLNKVATYAAIPAVMKNGYVIYAKPKNDMGLERIVVAAPVTVGESAEKMYVAVMLQRDTQNQRLYLHDVVTETEKELSASSNEHLNTTGPKATSKELYATNILLDALRVKGDVRASDENSNTGNPRGSQNQRGVKEKFSLRDSAGNALTAEQQEFFKDSQVRDDDGRLKVMYRGGNGDFTVFDRRKSKHSNLYGRGFYFTDSESHAQQYGNARAFYLNIQHPVSTTETTITRIQMQKFLDAVAENEDDFSFENYGYGATVDSVLNSVYGKSDFAMLYDVDQTAIGDMVAAVELFNEVNGTNYDGLILDTETVAFYPEQIKNVDNREPTGDPDIRFSERDDTRTDRDVLSDAADGDAANVREMEMLREYREKLQKYSSLTRRLEQQRELAQNAESKEERLKAKNRADNLAAQVSRADAQLTRMQNTKPLRELVARELKTRDSLAKENAMLRDRVEYWRGQTQRTKEATTDPKAVREAARAIIEQTSSNLDVDEVAGRLQELYDGIARGNEASYSEIRAQAEQLASDIVSDATAVDDEQYREYEDLRKYFKNQQLVVSAADRGDIPDFWDFRRRNMGRMRLKNGERTNVDQVYAELSEMYPEFFDQTRESQPSDQLYRIADVLDAVYAVNEYNPNAQYMREATQSVGNEILEQFFDLPQQRTFADRQAKKADQQKTHYLNQINELRKANDTRIAELRAQNRERLQEAVAREREKRDEQIARLKEHYDEQDAADKARREESAAVAKYRPRIEQKAKRLSDWLLKNSDKEHIPEPLKLAVGEFLESIDFTSKRALDGGALTKKDIRRSLRYTDRMQKLLDSLRGQNDDGTNDLGLYLDIPDGFLEEMQKHINTASDIVSQNPGENVVNRMSGEQLQQLDQMLTILTRSIQNANKLKANAHFETARQAAQATVLELDRLGQAKGRTKAGEKAAGFFNWENTTPYYAFQRFGEGGKAIFEALSDGWDKMAFNTQAVMDFTEQTYTPKEVKAWAKETHTFKLESGESVRMTTAQMMAFYCLSKREQAAGHLLGGGMRVEDIQNSGRKENVKQPDPFLLTQEDIAAINGALTKRQREVADKLQKYMNDQGGAWGNRVSMERFGYRAFTEENYFPIETMDSNRDAKDPGAKENDMFRLLNMSATKSLVYKANNALVVRDIFDVFSNHMADMAKYDALALPILDAMKWYNYREKQKLENGHVLTTTVQRSIEKAYGMDANKYFTTFIKDLNGVNEGGRGEGFAKKMLSNYKVAAVAANLRVALLQPTAYVRAVGVMSPKYLAKAFTEGKSAYKEAEANSGIALWKHMGFYDTNIGMNIRDQIKNAGTWKDSTVEFLMKGAEWGDRLTWGRLWNACKAEVRDKQKLTGDALLKATAERFREVVYSTQVVDSTMTRSQAMRGKSVYGSISTAFMSEPTLSYNLVLKAYTDYTTELRTTGDKKKAWNNAKGKVAWALATYLVSAAASGLVESAVDACRDDDEYATWLEKYLSALIGANYEEGKFSGVRPFDNNLFSDVDILSKLPILKDFMSMISGYGNDRMDTEWISNLIDAYRIWDETIKLATGKLDKPTSVTYNGNMTLYGKIYKTLKAVSQATGLPISAASREVVTLWNTIAGAVGKGDEWTIHTYDSGPESQIKYGLMDGYLTREEAQQLLVEKGLADNEDDAYWKVDKWATGEGKYDEALAAVLSGDKATFDAQVKELKEHGIGEKQLQSAVRSQAKEWYVGDDDGKRSITKEQALKILQQYGGKDADEAQKLVQKWTCEVVTGTDYDDIKDLYLDGKLTRSRAVDMLVRYGGMKQEDAQNKIDTADFVKAHPECDGISVEAVQKYNEQAKPAGLDAGTFWEAYQFKNDARTTRDSNGKAISGQGAMDKVAAYIDGLNISSAQKSALFLCFYSQKSLGKIRWSN